MVITALLLIAPRSWRQGLFIRWRKTRTFSCFISRLSAAHLIRSITRLSAFIFTIGKISDGNQTFLLTIATSNVKTGKLALSLPSTKTDAPTWQVASAATAGKNRTTILCFTRPNPAQKSHPSSHLRVASNAQEASSAHTTTLKQKKESQSRLANKEKELTSHTQSCQKWL